MTAGLPFRSRVRNEARTTAAPVALSLVATAPDGADRCRTLLRGEVAGEFSICRRHAVLVADALHARFGGRVDVQLLDVQNAPVVVVTAGGA